MRRAQDHAGRLVRFECFLPTRRTQTPAIAGFQTRKTKFRHGGRKIVATRFWKNRETRLSSRRRPYDCQHLLAPCCSSRPDESRSWAASSRFRAAHQARYVHSTGDQLHYPCCPATLSFQHHGPKALQKAEPGEMLRGRPRREMKVVSALTKGRNWNTQYTGRPLSTLRRSLSFCFLRLSLFGHVIAPDVIKPSPEYNQQTKGAI